MKVKVRGDSLKSKLIVSVAELSFLHIQYNIFIFSYSCSIEYHSIICFCGEMRKNIYMDYPLLLFDSKGKSSYSSDKNSDKRENADRNNFMVNLQEIY